uniref:Integrase catalytic domain-containing protein n=2 Tax=Nicotiana TaxID=4085 RepID=A0A1S4DQJ9_TOBAC|nr:PREDICTED: uncharacterized protein LOC104246756 [Nicotiana sylvestris]XP_016515695.1 PREDICTED: uncharacterized protein LOC107832368 [Nicotiana tabacum]
MGTDLLSPSGNRDDDAVSFYRGTVLEVLAMKNGTENQVADHLSRLETRNHAAEGDVIKDTFPDEQLLAVTTREVSWYADFMNYLASEEMPPDLDPHTKKKFLRDVRSYVWYEPFLFKSCADQLMRRCVPESEINVILHDCRVSPYDGNHAAVDYVLKWVETIVLPTNDVKVVVNFVKKHIFTWFGTLRVMISDGGTHFYNKLLDNLLAKYGVKHKVATAYHPQTSE